MDISNIVLSVLVFIFSFFPNGNPTAKENITSFVPTPSVVNEDSSSSLTFPTTQKVKENTELIKILPTSFPISDPDPIITCNSKTGKLAVRLSICKSYTDCPDGKGGYIFESQESCKARWNKISNDLKNAVNDYSQAMQEQNRLQNELLLIESERKLQEISDNASEKMNQITSNLPTIYVPQTTPFKLPPPQTPTPCPQTRTGEVIPCY